MHQEMLDGWGSWDTEPKMSLWMVFGVWDNVMRGVLIFLFLNPTQSEWRLNNNVEEVLVCVLLMRWDKSACTSLDGELRYIMSCLPVCRLSWCLKLTNIYVWGARPVRGLFGNAFARIPWTGSLFGGSCGGGVRELLSHKEFRWNPLKEQ